MGRAPDAPGGASLPRLRPATARAGLPSWACPVTCRKGTKATVDQYHHPTQLTEAESLGRFDLQAGQCLERDLLRKRCGAAKPAVLPSPPSGAAPLSPPPRRMMCTPQQHGSGDVTCYTSAVASTPTLSGAAACLTPVSSPSLASPSPPRRPQTCRARPSAEPAAAWERPQSCSVREVPPAVQATRRGMRAMLRAMRAAREGIVAEEAAKAAELESQRVYLTRLGERTLEENREDALRRLLSDPRAKQEAAVIEAWYVACAAGRHGRRALRAALRRLWREEAMARAGRIGDEVLRQQADLLEAVAEDVECARQAERAVVFAAESAARDAGAEEEVRLRARIRHDMAHCSQDLALSRAVDVLLESEDVERVLSEADEENERVRLLEQCGNDVLLVGEDRRWAVHVLEKFLWARKYGNAGREARLRELRFDLRKVWDETLLGKMNGVADYVLRSQEELARAIYDLDRARNRARGSHVSGGMSPRQAKAHSIRNSIYSTGTRRSSGSDTDVLDDLALLRQLETSKRARAEMRVRWEGIAEQRVARLAAEHTAADERRTAQEIMAYASFVRPGPAQPTQATRLYRHSLSGNVGRRVGFAEELSSRPGSPASPASPTRRRSSIGETARRRSSILDTFVTCYEGDRNMQLGEGGHSPAAPHAGSGQLRAVAVAAQEEARRRNLVLQGYLDGLLQFHFAFDDEAFTIMWRAVRRTEHEEATGRQGVTTQEATAYAALADDQARGAATASRKGIFRRAHAACLSRPADAFADVSVALTASKCQ
eukprot:TRINITY_DN16748_c0_g1_i1.p1 TRINITY_DN16748_c0_g1~~TRINITY_DN16748_c0_g1_i1.p1  ORF type:complete len:775 (+),score=169.79 TRINITY_DN16748_c0_g1_i1:88-2412(+)